MQVVSTDASHVRTVSLALLRFSRRNPFGAISAVLLILVVLIVVAAPVVAPYDPREADFTAIANPPSEAHILGTDQIGRDVLSRIIHGGRVSLWVAILSVGIGSTLGASIGIYSGYRGGRLDLLIERGQEILLAFPSIIFAVMLVVALGSGVWPVIVAIGVTRVPFVARVIRPVALQVRELDFVTAARSVGASTGRIIVKHVAPQCVAPFLVVLTAHLGVAIVLEAAMGFLGVGVPPPTPTWGNMLGDAAAAGLTPPWWLVVYPGLAIMIVVIAINLLGDALRDWLDPRLRGLL